MKEPSKRTLDMGKEAGEHQKERRMKVVGLRYVSPY